MGKPALHYTLQVSLEDDTGRITITSDEVPGLLIWAPPQEAFADVHESVKKLRLLNARAEMETRVGCIFRPVGAGDGETFAINPHCQEHGGAACMAKARQHFDERRQVAASPAPESIGDFMQRVRNERCPHGVAVTNHCEQCD